MALGRRKTERQETFWIAAGDLPRSEGHVFYRKLNELLSEADFDNFVETGWQADATASAVAGQSGAEAKTDFVNGLAVYQMTDTGLMAHADIAGTKYWKNKKLNR